MEADDPRAAFIRAAVVSLLHDHASGPPTDADAILAAHPEIAASGIHAAAVLGDDATVRRFLAEDLLDAGASAQSVTHPSGYAEADDLRAHGAG